MDIESIKAYIYCDADKDFSLKKLRNGIHALTVIFAMVCALGIFYRAYSSIGLFMVLFISYRSWFSIWTKKCFKNTFIHRLFLHGSCLAFCSLFFALSSCVFIDISGNYHLLSKLFLGFFICIVLFYLNIVFRIKKGAFFKAKLKPANWEKYYIPLAVAGFLGAKLVLSGASQDTAVDIFILLTSLLSVLCISGTQGLFKCILIKIYNV